LHNETVYTLRLVNTSGNDGGELLSFQTQ